MERSKIIDDVIAVLTIGGVLTQDPYRQRLFALCRDAHSSGPTDARPSLAADGLIDAINARWAEAKDHPRELHDLNVMWRAWLYAFARLL
jgi:hypothetical protein